MAEWIYGRQSVREALRSERRVRKVLISTEGQGPEISQILDLAGRRGLSCERASLAMIGRVAQGNHQGVAALLDDIAPETFRNFLSGLPPGPGTFVCLLDDVQDPQNLGAVIRAAVCFGCAGVVIPKHHSAPLGAAVMKASSGALAHARVAEIANLGVALRDLHEAGFWVMGADAGAGSEPISKTEFRSPLAIVLGNEHRGIKPILKKLCDRLVSIPAMKDVASLNVSQAASVFFYEARLRGAGGRGSGPEEI
ncbi:MAG: 23S rRNA (guanosine(2251)-2'-O)-methyltransferase RlmB [Elusimicrobia bacterium RIFCSPLOWO2_01_FULL_64_13]|nr:MAG: 23S rRNA (guanosine(2251)-2'-O)-methyltransferase RlmB [Elusimicrobia bacterium RIFCSPLOWO2_01_FULL_64_13]